MRIFWQPIYTFWVIVSFTICFLMIVPVVVLVSLPNRPSSRKRIYHILKFSAGFWLMLIGIFTKKSGTLPAKTQRYVIVANHISYMDAVAIFLISPNYFRPLGKIEMARIPVFGFVYKQIVLLVNRSSAHNRARSMRLMWRALRRECSILLFPEGTFNETEAPLLPFHDGAFRLAIHAQTPLLPVLLPDMVNRWHYSHWWKMSPGKNRIIYLPAIQTEGLQIEQMPELKKQVAELMSRELKNLGYPKNVV